MNVVVLCLDTFRADCIAAAGRKTFMKTPNLDRLAGEGVLFDNAFGEAQPTIQFRRTLNTGMRCFPWRFEYDTKGAWPTNDGWHKIPPEQTTLAELLMENGYITGLSADTYHLFKPTFNFMRGMSWWRFTRGQESDNYRVGPLDELDMTRYFPPNYTMDRPKMFQYLLNIQDRKSKDDYFPAQVVARACEFLDEVRNSHPFFLWIDSFDPHEPWDPPDEYADIYDPDWDENWEPVLNLHANNKDDKIIKRQIARYYGECTFVDECIGRVLDKLEEMKALEDTLIVVCSDHGTELLDHGSLHKGIHRCRYRHNNEILCLMRFPGKEHAGKRIKPYVMSHDLFPTVAAVCGTTHEPVDGHNLMPLIEGKTESIYDTLISGWSRWATLRNREYSYCCNFTTEDRDESLFELTNDLGEMNNIAKDRQELCDTFYTQIEEFIGKKLPTQTPDKGYPTPAPFTVWSEKSVAVKAFFS